MVPDCPFDGPEDAGIHLHAEQGIARTFDILAHHHDKTGGAIGGIKRLLGCRDDIRDPSIVPGERIPLLE